MLNYYAERELGVKGKEVSFDWEKSAYIIDGVVYKVDEFKPMIVRNDVNDYVKENYLLNRRGQVFNKKKPNKPLSLKAKGNYIVCNLGNRKSYNVHISMAITFLGEEEGKEVNHLDLCKDNNELFNLEWCTRRENIIHYLKATGKKIEYAELVGKTYNSTDGKFTVIDFNEEIYSVLIEFNNTGNQKWITQSVLERNSRPKDNYYIITEPNGTEHMTRTITGFKEVVHPSRFSDMLTGKRDSYKGWTIKRQNNVKIK